MSSPYTRLPVYRETKDNVIGFVHVRDLAAQVAGRKAATLEAVLRPILAVPANTPIHRLLPQLRRRGQRIALVVGEFGDLAGIVTLQDLLDELLGLPPEAKDLGGQSLPERMADGRLRLPGLLPLVDVKRWIGVDWRDAQVTTIGGLILKQFAHLPQPGERLDLDGVAIEVERLDRQMIASVLVTPPPPAGTQNENEEEE
jgi:CBS domain containing-hemolysin-like protein